jgi:hypothetical protein
MTSPQRRLCRSHEFIAAPLYTAWPGRRACCEPRPQPPRGREGLNWLDAAQGEPERKLAFLDFLLRHPVARERQFHPEAIPASVIEEFLVWEARQKPEPPG